MARRQTRRPLALAALLVGVGLGCFLTWLRAAALAPEAAKALASRLGCYVTVANVETGILSASLKNVRLGDPSAPWLTIAETRTDIGLPGFVLGIAPQRVTLVGAHLLLSFAADGSLLTRLPTTQPDGRVPVVLLRGSRLTLRQAGQPDFTVTGIEGEMRPSDEGFSLIGRISDPTWRDWSYEFRPSGESDAFKLNLRTESSVRATPPLLAKIPFVSESVWQTVTLDGMTTADITLLFGGSAVPGLRYRVEAKPVQTHVHVPSIDLRADEAGGTVIVEDGLVTLVGVQGRVAGGAVRTEGDLDFRPNPSILHFRVAAENVAVEQLPVGWGMPLALAGRLDGTADLIVRPWPDHTRTEGLGRGVIRDARLGTLQVGRTIPLAVRADAGGFHFRPDLPGPWGQALGILTGLLLLPEER